MFSKKATKIDEIFTLNLTLCSKCQIDGEDFLNFSALLRKHELYLLEGTSVIIQRFVGYLVVHDMYPKVAKIGRKWPKSSPNGQKNTAILASPFFTYLSSFVDLKGQV